MTPRRALLAASIIAAAVMVSDCGGGGGSALGTGGCSGSCTTATDFLTVADVKRVIAQAVFEAQARNAKATIAVTDRVGNVLAVYRMNGAAPTFRITSGHGITGGLENVELPDVFAAISKAITGAYLSSEGNAFSTRTASQIVQENFNPREFQQPSGPLYGVQFSQFSCSDLMRRKDDGSIGPKRSPLGLAADPGGLPLYKAGRLVGGVGVISDGIYGLDIDITDVDTDADELIAVAGGSGFDAPTDRRADRITADGRTFRYTDSESLASNPANAPAFAALPGALVAVAGYADAAVVDGVAFGTPASGYRADTGPFADLAGYILVDAANNNRYPVRGGTDGLLTQAEVTQILRSGLDVGNRARAQIRRPLGTQAQVGLVVVDTKGEILGFACTPDAPVFGTDVALQKARTALFFSQPGAAAALAALPPANYLTPPVTASIADYAARSKAFLGSSAFSDGTAYSARAIGNLHRPFFPDGIAGTQPGPLSTPYQNWSIFALGLQLDLAYNKLVASAGGDASVGCTGIDALKNGIQIFPGGVPIYRNNVLVGAVGVSGDGVDQDDMVAFLGLANAGRILNTGIANAPAAIRADNIVPAGTGTRLRYVQCPQSPFNNSTEQNVCAGL